MQIEKTYKTGFVLDSSKLTRMLSIAEEKLGPPGRPLLRRGLFQTTLSDGREFSTDVVEEVFGLDNSQRKHVRRLDVDFNGSRGRVELKFKDGSGKYESGSAAQLEVTSSDSQLARELMALLEEQIERTFPTGLMERAVVRLKNSSFGDFLSEAFPFFLLVGLLAVIAAAYLSSSFSDLSNKMWLSDHDLEQLRPLTEQTSPLTSEQIGDIQRRQLRNIVNGRDQSGSRLITHILADWRFWLVLSPVVIIAFAIFYLFKTCYPSAVFLWGDMEEWYGKLLRRRSIIWQVIVISMSVGILSNLFVFGLAGYFKQ